MKAGTSDRIEITKWKAIFFLTTTILFKSSASVMAKQAALTSEPANLISIITNPWYVGELAFLMAQAIVWFYTLRELTLSFAYPFLSLSFILTFLAAVALFNEPVAINHLLGVILIFTGVIVGSSLAGERTF